MGFQNWLFPDNKAIYRGIKGRHIGLCMLMAASHFYSRRQARVVVKVFDT